MPFRLTNAPVVFMNLMNRIFKSILDKYILEAQQNIQRISHIFWKLSNKGSYMPNLIKVSSGWTRSHFLDMLFLKAVCHLIFPRLR